MRSRLLFSILLICIGLGLAAQGVTFKGELVKWHKITLELTGPEASETAATFTDKRMEVTFTHVSSGSSFQVPGYFAADGDAANSSATSGNKWHAILRPDKTGEWNYAISFYEGNNVANAASPTGKNETYSVSGSVGIILDIPTNLEVYDMRTKGRLLKEGNHMRWAETGEHYLKIGPDSPENYLDYKDFDFASTRVSDGTKTFEHSYPVHVSDWRNGDPVWKTNKGKGAIGVINYLRLTHGVNSFSMSLFGGDDVNVFPWNTRSGKLVYDISKLAQWEILFDHAETMGLVMHYKLAEAENHNEDGMKAGTQSLAIYYREMMARFGHHLAVEWNISEEFGNVNGKAGAYGGTYAGTAAEAVKRGKLLQQLDPYDNLVVLHTGPGPLQGIYDEVLKQDASAIEGISMQNNENNDWAVVYTYTKKYTVNSRSKNAPWVVATDEQNPGGSGVWVSKELDAALKSNGKPARTNVLWGCFMAGGAGVMWYGGSLGDFQTENFNRFDDLHKWSVICVDEFFNNQHIPYSEMTVSSASSSGWCLAKDAEVYVVYLKNGGTSNLTLPSGNYIVKWFDPRNGGNLQDGSVTTITSTGTAKTIGTAPDNTTLDWAVLVYNPGKFDPAHGTSSIDVSIDNTSAKVFPNPFTDYFTVTNIPANATVRMFNISGQEMKIPALQQKLMDEQLLIDGSELLNGMYILQVNDKAYRLIKTY